MNRKQFLQSLLALPIIPSFMNFNELSNIASSFSSTEKMPVLFVGHGNPMNAIEENDFVKEVADKKEAIIKELQEQGVMVEALYEAVDKQVDLFDLICHIAYEQPPLTRKERANNVKKRNYFTKYDYPQFVPFALLSYI